MELLEERSPSREIAVQRSARNSRRGGHVVHACLSLRRGENARGGAEDLGRNPLPQPASPERRGLVTLDGCWFRHGASRGDVYRVLDETSVYRKRTTLAKETEWSLGERDGPDPSCPRK